MNKEKITSIIDFYLKKFVEVNGNTLPNKIEAEMADPNQNQDEEWRIWFPIASKVTDNEIKEFENRLGCEFPEDYKIFLKHKHFYELYILEASFFKHPVNSWKESLGEMIFHENLKDDLIEKGYIPFANWSDWGLLCFDSNRNKEDNNYPIVLWDHEKADEVEDVFNDFYNLISEDDIENEQPL
ncbi:SMI1/KNR4 family protein [Flavobacterium sp. EDS]|uniref:SMI1/KNR4 family protein n=1 Tax=Flavobacterium sp. EDS TaxID=2897328 RepID=UPI001E4588F8|nr:SMI1/KNR4 family protein [Flavobacterium sp. EDS]MCD0475390.1 SMI1/KNR4 family protein [Flavobacterium sp. EDS]